MNWMKITGSSIVAFCTTAIAVNLIGQPQEAILAGFITAILNGFLAMGVGLQEEGKEIPSKANNLLVL